MKTLTAAVFGVALSLLLAPAALADNAGLMAAYGFEETAGATAIRCGSGRPSRKKTGAVCLRTKRIGCLIVNQDLLLPPPKGSRRNGNA